jgi:hypothetical protein
MDLDMLDSLTLGAFGAVAQLPKDRQDLRVLHGIAGTSPCPTPPHLRATICVDGLCRAGRGAEQSFPCCGAAKP